MSSDITTLLRSGVTINRDQVYKQELGKKGVNLLSVKENIDLFNHVDDTHTIQNALQKFGILNLVDGLVLTGSFIRSLFYKDKANVNNELHVWVNNKKIDFNSNENFKFSNLITFPDYYISNSNGYKLIIHKKFQISPLNILTNFEHWYDKVCYYNKDIYVLPSFLINFNKYICDINTKDPNVEHISVKSDLLRIYNRKATIKELIETVSITELIEEFKTNKYSEGIIYNGHNAIEFAIMLYLNANNKILKQKYYTIIEIIVRQNVIYKRLPLLGNFCCSSFLAKGDESEYQKLCDLLKTLQCKYILKHDAIMGDNITNIHANIIKHFITEDSCDLVDYLHTYPYEFTDADIKTIVKNNACKVLESLIDGKLITDTQAVICVLMTEKLNLLEKLNDTKEDKKAMIITIAKSILIDIIHNNKLLTLYYLSKLTNIFDHKFEHGNNVLHMIAKYNMGTGNDIIKIVNKISPNKINEMNDNLELPIFCACDNRTEIFIKLLSNSVFEAVDNNGNTLLHRIVITQNINLLKYLINSTEYKPGILLDLDKQNNDGETALIISAKKSSEQMYYYLLELGAGDKHTDIHGNTVYFYMCKNKMCIGTKIKSSVNRYGLTPENYANVSPNLWHFV